MKTRLVNENFKENYLDNLLIARGLKKNELNYFYNVPNDSELEGPILLDNAPEGAKLLFKTIDNDGNICIIVDSDVDGFTSAAIIYQYIKFLKPDILVDYILHEGKGHGLSDTIDNIINSDTHYNLIVLPDSSTNDKEYHDKLANYGAACLILDHHLSESDDYSDNAIIINNQLSPHYSNKDLSGAGVTWQFCRFLDELNGNNYANELIDLAALGIVSDMMNVLQLENRYIIYNGFNNVKNYFFQKLCEKQSFSMGGKVTPITVAFYVTPLINAMIRVGTMDEKERLFKAFIEGHELVPCNKRGAKGTLEECAVESVRECVNARSKQNRTLDKAMEELEYKIFKYDLLENKILFIKLDEEDFPPELNGLLAMKLAAKYKKPTIVARANEEGEVKGSQRGLNESELTSFKKFLDDSEYFTFTAGHDNASGIGIMEQNIFPFLNYANQELKNVDFGENFYEVNFELDAFENVGELIFDLGREEGIFGQHNNEPVIHITKLYAYPKDIQIMGKKQDTVKIENNGVSYMFFKCADRLEEFDKKDGMVIELVGKPNINHWGGNITPQIFVTNFEVKDLDLTF